MAKPVKANTINNAWYVTTSPALRPDNSSATIKPVWVATSPSVTHPLSYGDPNDRQEHDVEKLELISSGQANTTHRLTIMSSAIAASSKEGAGKLRVVNAMRRNGVKIMTPIRSPTN